MLPGTQPDARVGLPLLGRNLQPGDVGVFSLVSVERVYKPLFLIPLAALVALASFNKGRLCAEAARPVASRALQTCHGWESPAWL